MPKDRVLKEVMEKPDEAVREAHRYEALSGENIEVSRRIQKLRLTSDSPAPTKAAPSGQHRRGRARPSQQLDLYEGPVADSGPRQMRLSRREKTVGLRCPFCRSEIRVTAVALTMECPGCHAIVDALEVGRGGRIDAAQTPSPGSVPAPIEARWQAAEPILPEALPSFFVQPTPIKAEASTARTSRRRTGPMVSVALGAAALLGAAAGAGYWQINSKQREVAPEVAMSLEARPIVALLVPATGPPQPPPQLVVGLAQPGNKPPPGEPTTMPVAAPAVAVPASEAPASVPAVPIPHAVSTAKPVAAPADNVFVVRFDSKFPGLTPSGLRALDAALRAADKGHKVRIEIAGCEDHDNTPTAIDCAALTRGLKWILADRGVDRPADLIASLYPPPIGVMH
jgi:hypothetical protein